MGDFEGKNVETTEFTASNLEEDIEQSDAEFLSSKPEIVSQKADEEKEVSEKEFEENSRYRCARICVYSRGNHGRPLRLCRRRCYRTHLDAKTMSDEEFFS